MNDHQQKIDSLRSSILARVREYYALTHDPALKEFKPGESRVNYAGRVFDADEMVNLTRKARLGGTGTAIGFPAS